MDRADPRALYAVLREKKRSCASIEDIYDYMQPELIAVLKEKSDTYRTEEVWRRGMLG